MALEHYIIRGSSRLRCGYTTGSCAAMAAEAACRMLITQKEVLTAEVITPKGIRVEADVEQAEFCRRYAVCGVRKDAGDDCDATDKMLICAKAEYNDSGIKVTGGKGIGIVTKPGLDRQVGEYAINSTPLKMIYDAVQNVCNEQNCGKGIKITVFAPDGEEIAKKTFNSNLGIEGGISILGTSGIVEPQSVSALVESIGLEIGQLAAEGYKKMMLAPGNYAEKFIAANIKISDIPVVKCSNYIGAALDFAAAHRFEQVLLVSHIGKAVKIAGGIMDTHSRTADCRAEIFAAHAACCGADTETVKALMSSTVTENCLDLLADKCLLNVTLESIFTAVQLHLERRAAGAFKVGAISFKNGYIPLGETVKAKEILREWNEFA